MRRLLCFALLLLSGCNVPAASAAETPVLEAVYRLDQQIRGGEADQITALAHWAHLGGAKRLVIIIDSPGGEAVESLKIYRAIFYAELPTVCRVEGEASSGAFLALQACTERVAKKDAHLMTHRPAVVINHPGVMTVETAKRLSDELQMLANAMDALIAARLVLSLDAYREHVADGAMWIMDAPGALAARAVDRVE